MAEHTTRVDLTDEQLAHLRSFRGDLGDVAEKVSAAELRLEYVEKLDLEPHLARFVADVVAEAEREGFLIYRRCTIRYCRLCGARPEPVRYKSGRRKGQVKDNGVISGVELAYRFVTMRNHVTLGGCHTCVTASLEALKKQLEYVRAEVPPQLAMPGRAPWKRWKRRHCTECGWEGHEGEMREIPAVMGGRYHGGCPKCPAENSLFVTKIKAVDGFVVERDDG